MKINQCITRRMCVSAKLFEVFAEHMTHEQNQLGILVKRHVETVNLKCRGFRNKSTKWTYGHCLPSGILGNTMLGCTLWS